MVDIELSAPSTTSIIGLPLFASENSSASEVTLTQF